MVRVHALLQQKFDHIFRIFCGILFEHRDNAVEHVRILAFDLIMVQNCVDYLKLLILHS